VQQVVERDVGKKLGRHRAQRFVFATAFIDALQLRAQVCDLRRSRRRDRLQSLRELAEGVVHGDARKHVGDENLIRDELLDVTTHGVNARAELARKLVDQHIGRDAAAREIDRRVQLASRANGLQLIAATVECFVRLDVAQLSRDIVQTRVRPQRRTRANRRIVCERRAKSIDVMQPDFRDALVAHLARKCETRFVADAADAVAGHQTERRRTRGHATQVARERELQFSRLRRVADALRRQRERLRNLGTREHELEKRFAILRIRPFDQRFERQQRRAKNEKLGRTELHHAALIRNMRSHSGATSAHAAASDTAMPAVPTSNPGSSRNGSGAFGSGFHAR